MADRPAMSFTSFTSRPAPDLNPYNRPERMTDLEKEVFQRIADAGTAGTASVTRTERNVVFRRPSPDEEDRLCIASVGLTMPALRAKAIANPDALTEEDCKLLTLGADYAVRDYFDNPFWHRQLPPDERALVEKVWGLISFDEPQEQEALNIAREREKNVFFPKKLEAKKRKREEAERQLDRLVREGTPKWVNELKDAGLPRHGFVIFRTAYGPGMGAAWQNFTGLYQGTCRFHFASCWRRSDNLASKHRPVWVGGNDDDDAVSLDGADIATLRRRFRTMREQGEIPDGIATDCFLVVDEATLRQHKVVTRSFHEPKGANPFETSPVIRAVNPDHDESTSVPSEGDLAEFTGEISIPLPKVFDWLYYCFFAKSEDWEARFRATKGGPAELPDWLAPYPFYRSGTGPQIS
ncbi:hypothetical protein N0V82_006187 [Gnomoniopsis sp. IMI 355080]|nr:hypothetical protein N0V82_006187 [Gnomoniopsis sp. IMI 355080]